MRFLPVYGEKKKRKNDKKDHHVLTDTLMEKPFVQMEVDQATQAVIENGHHKREDGLLHGNEGKYDGSLSQEQRGKPCIPENLLLYG